MYPDKCIGTQAVGNLSKRLGYGNFFAVYHMNVTVTSRSFQVANCVKGQFLETFIVLDVNIVIGITFFHNYIKLWPLIKGVVYGIKVGKSTQL